MASTARLIAGGGVILFAVAMGSTYTNPSWTRRKFDTKKIPPFVYNSLPLRNECIQNLKVHESPENPLDLMVIGGGSIGTGVALDAVTRGLSVGLVEMGDYASETSSRSTKLIHGGIRYLEKAVFQCDLMQMNLVAEALSERSIMIHQAPHLCHGLATLIPCYSPYEVVTYWGGAKLYDFIAALHGGTIAYSGYLTSHKTMSLCPNLRKINDKNKPLLGAVRYYDGQMNDARLCFSVAMTAALYGAATVNYTEVKKSEAVRDVSGKKLMRLTVKDCLNNEELTIYSKSIINSTGPFASEVEKLSGGESTVENVPSSGAHIVVEKRYCPRNHEAMVFPSSDGRVIFTIPWLGGCLMGTTDEKTVITHDPKPKRKEVDFILKNARSFFGDIPQEAVLSTWSGIRPLAKLNRHGKGNESTENMVREHVITVNPDKLTVTVTGGKWTTYRKIAEQTVDTLRDTIMKGNKLFKPCCTSSMVLYGSRNFNSVPAAAVDDIPQDVHKHWRGNYGDSYSEISALAHKDNNKYLKRLVEGCPVIEAEVLWSAEKEHCEHVVDFISRRTRMSFVNVKTAEAAIPRVSELMGQAKKWSRSKINQEKAHAYAAMNSFKC
ncbi:unnamed protein product [Phytomonas sp. Hart1]|nr:unnamed protein product [Phytomonas sp. Hart1]|eukprot:CCW68776.1 unnamed protein product [Phytomonas sp. isolate Hart1]